jgi:HEAT repeat protein
MDTSATLYQLIATALTGVVKQIKAVRYYPPRHPALQKTAEECLRGFLPLLEMGSHLSLTVRKEEFLFDDAPVGKGNQVLAQLATFCFARRIQYLTFMTDLKSADLHHFVHYLLLDPQTIQKQGGIQAILERARLTTIWTNIRDLDEILQRRQELEELPEDPDFDPAAVLEQGAEGDEEQTRAEAMSLESLIQRMEQEAHDDRFRSSLQELVPLIRLQLIEERRPLILRALLLLCRSATAAQSSEQRRTDALEALDQLANDEMTTYLVDYLFAEEDNSKAAELLARVLVFLGRRVVGPLVQRLTGEENTSRRKLLSGLVVGIGPPALNTLYEYLEDERWFVQRNVIAILGEIRDQDSLDKLTPQLQQDDVRVRRETIRALTRIGGVRAVEILLQVAAHDDHDMRRQAVISLGAIRAVDAIPTLLSFLSKRGWSPRTLDLKKDAIRALGEIRSGDAVPALLAVLGKKRLLKRQLNDELRAAAAVALGDIAAEDARQALERATHDKSAKVSRAASQALMQLDRIHHEH